MVKCQEIMAAMERIAPRHLAEEWDNPGLLVGNPAQEVQRLLVCLDVRESVIHQAMEMGCGMIVSHHPLIFRPMKKIRTDLAQGRMLRLLLQHDIAVFAAHTNLDIAEGGVNDALAAAIGLEGLQPFAVTSEERLEKLAVYVPRTHAGRVRDAITAAGAGWIGKYSCCTFNVEGRGTFFPREGTKPFIGEQGKLETVDEVRIETILPSAIEKKVLRAMHEAHPYEEAAYDLYPLNNSGKKNSLGRIGTLPHPLSVEVFAKQVKERLHADAVRLVKAGEKNVQKVAVCGGSGAEFIDKAAFLGADAYVTGDVKYHDAQRAVELGLHLVDAGHFPTEALVVDLLAGRLREELGRAGAQVNILVDRASKDFFSIM